MGNGVVCEHSWVCRATLQFVSQRGFATGVAYHITPRCWENQYLSSRYFSFFLLISGKDVSPWQTMLCLLCTAFQRKAGFHWCSFCHHCSSVFLRGLIYWFPAKCCCREKSITSCEAGDFSWESPTRHRVIKRFFFVYPPILSHKTFFVWKRSCVTALNNNTRSPGMHCLFCASTKIDFD